LCHRALLKVLDLQSAADLPAPLLPLLAKLLPLPPADLAVTVEVSPVEAPKRGLLGFLKRDAVVTVQVGRSKHRSAHAAANGNALAPLPATTRPALAAKRLGAGPFVPADHIVAVDIEPLKDASPAVRVGAPRLAVAADLAMECADFIGRDSAVTVLVDTAEQGTDALHGFGARLDSVARTIGSRSRLGVRGASARQ
jgi:hypothetical protein